MPHVAIKASVRACLASACLVCVRMQMWTHLKEGTSLATVPCDWFRGYVIHYFITDLYLSLNKISNSERIFTILCFLHCTQSDQRTWILHSIGLQRYKVWNYQGGLERGSLPSIQQANSKEADRIPVGLENEWKLASVCQNSSRHLQKKKPKKPTTLPDFQLGL